MCTNCNCDNSSALPIGPTGATGASAYALAVTNGFVGTLGQWLASLVATSFLEAGSGIGAIQTKDNGANASGNQSLAFGVNAISSGIDSIAVGQDAQAGAVAAIAIGNSSESGADGAISMGFNATALNEKTIAIGEESLVSGLYATGIGYGAKANIAETTQLQNCIITRQDAGEGSPQRNFAGALVTITTEEIDLKALGTFTIPISTGAKFYPDAVDLVITNASIVTVQPFIRVGITGTVAKLLAIVQTAALTATYDRQRFNTLLSSAGEQNLRVEITTAATATTMKGRFVFRGILIENE